MISRFGISRLLGLLLAGSMPASPTVEAEVDFSRVLRVWDGFGVNYVETAQTRDYRATPEDYGGFGLMTEARRRDVLDKIFGDDGLKPGIVKMFLDPFHEGYTKAGNDNDDPHDINPAGFDHTTTTKWMRDFAREGLARTRARGADLTFILTIYGPQPWVTKQKFVRGRDLDPAEKYECAEYLISWAKYLREVEKLPAKYVSIHNEGEANRRWPADGSTADTPDRDHNMYWPPAQVVDFLRFMRPMLDKQGLHDVGLTPGETTTWDLFFTRGYAAGIAKDPVALANMALMTSHGFRFVKREDNPSLGVDLVRSKRPELHAWTTSMSWGKMDAAFVDDMRAHIYEGKTNAIIPWATIQRVGTWIGGDPNPGTAFNVDDKGNVSVMPGYYFFKQVSRAGQPGMAVCAVFSAHDAIRLIAFGGNATKHPDAFVAINVGDQPQRVSVRVKRPGANAFRAYRTTNDGRDLHSDVGGFSLEAGQLIFEAPGGSVTTFVAQRLSE